MTPRRLHPLALAVAVLFSGLLVGAGGDDGPREASRVRSGATLRGDPQRGWELFRTKNCLQCHAIWGEGGVVAPDLGRTRSLGHLSAGELAGTMWNHIPRMWSEMGEKRVRHTDITVREMSDLFALLLFIRYADEPGDAAAGRQALIRSRCGDCHSIGAGADDEDDLQRWSGFVNPVVWAQKMWAHAGQMEVQMAAEGIAWPRLEGSDLVDIVAYVRSEAGRGDKIYLEPGSSARGEKVFQKAGCTGCHGFGDESAKVDLASSALPSTLAGIASTMWNHAPAMAREKTQADRDAPTPTAQEMADLISYLVTRRYFLAEGDVARGEKIFAAKHCDVCHVAGQSGGRIGPKLSAVKGPGSAVFMSHSIWTYGPTMLDKMAQRGIPWPRFEASEMADLIAFLDAVEDETEDDD